ncbi:MAG TPA: sugar ABC transporter permease, partial [Galbitalea sp.]
MTTTSVAPAAAATSATTRRGVPPRRPGAGRRRERLIQWLFILPAIAYVILFFGYPIVQNTLMSFQDYTTKTFFTGEAPFVGFANYVTVTTSSLFSTTLINTALFTIGSIVGQFVLGLALALFFRRKFPLNGILR